MLLNTYLSVVHLNPSVWKLVNSALPVAGASVPARRVTKPHNHLDWLLRVCVAGPSTEHVIPTKHFNEWVDQTNLYHCLTCQGGCCSHAASAESGKCSLPLCLLHVRLVIAGDKRTGKLVHFLLGITHFRWHVSVQKCCLVFEWNPPIYKVSQHYPVLTLELEA